MADVDHAEVARLLQQSKAAHQRYRDNSPTIVPNGRGGTMPVPGNPTVAREALYEAARLRDEAHKADPEHTAPAWQQETVHGALMAFYEAQLTKA